MKFNMIIISLYIIRFKKNKIILQRIMIILTLINNIPFYMISANTLFLLYINDIDKMRIKLNNLKNMLIQNKKRIPIIYK